MFSLLHCNQKIEKHVLANKTLTDMQHSPQGEQSPILSCADLPNNDYTHIGEMKKHPIRAQQILILGLDLLPW